MNIERINSANIAGMYKNNQNQVQVAKSGKTFAKEGVVLSESGKIFNVALTAVKEFPDVREAKVNQISDRIKANNYNVSSNEIADKIIKGTFFDKSV